MARLEVRMPVEGGRGVRLARVDGDARLGDTETAAVSDNTPATRGIPLAAAATWVSHVHCSTGARAPPPIAAETRTPHTSQLCSELACESIVAA